MIAHIFGKVEEKFSSSVIVDVQGVGYEISLARLDFDSLSLGAEVKLYTYHHIREQAQELFGFSSLAAKRLFELLISVQGIGPKAAMAILSIADSEQIRSAIVSSNVTFIAQASGVGKKSAERVIVDLKDKVGQAGTGLNLGTTDILAVSGETDEALEALIALGYTLADATKALAPIAKDLPTSERVTKALRSSAV
jgi:Holliday junction DNA helicase RuvA